MLTIYPGLTIIFLSMGRKSRVEQRKTQILDAFERCVLRYGLEGASLEQIAHESGLQRSLIRHYVGNREDLVNAFIQRILVSYAAEVEQIFQKANEEHTCQVALDYLFAYAGSYEPLDKAMIDILTTSVERYPYAKQHLVALFERLTLAFADLLKEMHPQACPSECLRVAYAVLCLAEANETLVWLGLSEQHTHSARISAEKLILSLGGD